MSQRLLTDAQNQEDTNHTIYDVTTLNEDAGDEEETKEILHEATQSRMCQIIITWIRSYDQNKKSKHFWILR